MATEGSVGDWSGTYLARSGVDPGATAAGYAAFSLSDDHRQVVGDGIVGAAGPRATVGLGALLRGRPWRQRRVAGARRGRCGLRTGRRGPRQRRARALQRRRPDGIIAGRWRRFGRNSGYAGLLIGPVAIGAVASGIGLRPTIVMLAGVALLSAVFAASRAGGLVRGG